ncbi:MAG: heavy-metal-associated domain-containing protein [Verrucomicrobia bacterium]|nr:heavy-metal-associated domain-containing protein [Verrucomicrobiota bacterium]
MKTRLNKWILLAVLLLCAGCFRNNIRIEIFPIAQLRSEDAVNRIAQALRPVSGISEIRPDLMNHTLTVIFNGNVAHIKNIEYAIVKAGFDLPHWPANPADKAKLPESLR